MVSGLSIQTPPIQGERSALTLGEETYGNVAGRWTYLYRAIDQYGQGTVAKGGRSRTWASEHFVRIADSPRCDYHAGEPISLQNRAAWRHL